MPNASNLRGHCRIYLVFSGVSLTIVYCTLAK